MWTGGAQTHCSYVGRAEVLEAVGFANEVRGLMPGTRAPLFASPRGGGAVRVEAAGSFVRVIYPAGAVSL